MCTCGWYQVALPLIEPGPNLASIPGLDLRGQSRREPEDRALVWIFAYYGKSSFVLQLYFNRDLYANLLLSQLLHLRSEDFGGLRVDEFLPTSEPQDAIRLLWSMQDEQAIICVCHAEGCCSFDSGLQDGQFPF